VSTHIIAMGGGGFMIEPDNPLLDEYVLAQAASPRPRVLFLPTAQGDSHDAIARFYNAFERFACVPTLLSIFRPFGRPDNFETAILSSDVVYVAGGTTRAMIAVWREYGIDIALRKAWERGVVLAGLSAGALCWFEEGHTDSTPGGLSKMDCLGFLQGSLSCHFDGDPKRRPSYSQLVVSGRIRPGYAVDDGVALHFIDGKLYCAVSSRPNAGARFFSVENGELREVPLAVRYLKANA
jgi:dipeptidase E